MYLKDGKPLAEGDILRQPDLARTLQLLADHGHEGFYRGDTARRMLDSIKAEGGQWSADELAAYQVREREPIRLDYRGWRITTAPPPSSGGIAVAQMLQMLAPFDVQKLDEAERVHLVVESMRRAFHDRTCLLYTSDAADE